MCRYCLEESFIKCKNSNAYQLLTYLLFGSAAFSLASLTDSLLYWVLRCWIFFVASAIDIEKKLAMFRSSSFRFCLSLRVSQRDGFQMLGLTCKSSISFIVLSLDHSIVLSREITRYKHTKRPFVCCDLSADRSLNSRRHRLVLLSERAREALEGRRTDRFVQWQVVRGVAKFWFFYGMQRHLS